LSKELIDGAKIQINQDVVPNQLAEKVVPVMEVNPKLLRRCNILRTGTRTTTGLGTIYTTSATKDTYLVAATLSMTSSALADNVIGYLTVVCEGQAETRLLIIEKETLTAGSQVTNLSLSIPIKLARNSSTRYASTFTAGAVSISATLLMYEAED